MSEKRYQKRQYVIDTPVLFPQLSKKLLNLDRNLKDKTKVQLIGDYTSYLQNQQNKSIYKKLLSDNKNKDSLGNLSYKEIKEIRNKYLRKLVESNPFFFPKELSQNEYKRPLFSKEDRVKKLMKGIEELAKKEKMNLDISRKESTFLNLSRKESIFDDYKKRKESIGDDIIDGKNYLGKKLTRDDGDAMRARINNEEYKNKEINNRDTNEENGENGDIEEENSYADENYINDSDNDDSQNDYDDDEGDMDDGGEY